MDVDDRSNSLVITDASDRIKDAERVIAELDRPVDQVLIQVYLIETFEELDHHLGITWTSSDTGTMGTVTGASKASRFPFNVNTQKLLGEDIFQNDRLLRDINGVLLWEEVIEDKIKKHWDST